MNKRLPAYIFCFITAFSLNIRGELFQSDYASISVPGTFNEWNLTANYLMKYDDHKWTGQFRFIGNNYDDPGTPFHKLKFAANQSFDVAWGDADQSDFVFDIQETGETNGTDILIDMGPVNPYPVEYIRLFFDELSGEYSLEAVDQSGAASLYGANFLSSSSEALLEGLTDNAAYGTKTFALLDNGMIATGQLDCAASYIDWGATRKSTPTNALNIAVNRQALVLITKEDDTSLTFTPSIDHGDTYQPPFRTNFSSLVGTYSVLGRGSNEFIAVVELWQENKLEILFSGNNGSSFTHTHTISGGVDTVFLEDLDLGDGGFYLAYAVEGSGAKETGIAFSENGTTAWTNSVLSTDTNHLFRDMLISEAFSNIAVVYDKASSEYVFYRQSGSSWNEYHRFIYGWEARDLDIGEENGNMYILIEDAYISEDFGNQDHVWHSTDGGDSWIPTDLINQYNMLKGGDRIYFLSSFQWFMTRDFSWMGTDTNNTTREVFAVSDGGTSITNPPSVLVSKAGSPADYMIDFGQLKPGGLYDIQTSSNLTHWSSLASFHADSTSHAVTSSFNQAMGFHRAAGLWVDGDFDLTITTESWPSGTMMSAAVFYSLDDWASTNVAELSHTATIGENDIWSSVIGSFNAGETIRYYIAGEGRGCNMAIDPSSGDHTAVVPEL